MEYKVEVQDMGKFYEATSYQRRGTESDSWVDLGKPEGGIEKVILNSALQIAHERKKKRTRVTINVE